MHFRASATHLLPHVPFYAELFKGYGVDSARLRRVDDWHREGLPLIKKAEYLKRPRDFVVSPPRERIFGIHMNYLACLRDFSGMVTLLLSPDKRKILHDFYSPKMLVFSGGTETDNPTPVLLTADQKFKDLRHAVRVAGDLLLAKESEAVKKIGMNLFPYAPHLGWHAVHEALDLNADLNLHTAAGGAIPTERLVSLAAQMQPNIICGMHDYLRNRFLPMMIAQKIKLPSRVLFVNGAQKMLEAERGQLVALARRAGALEVTVIDLFAASETKTALMPECAHGTGFHHLSPLSTAFRLVTVGAAKTNYVEEWDYTDHDGALATWTLDGGGSQLNGYLLGDTCGRAATDACVSCGLRVQRLFDVSRSRDVASSLMLTGTVEEKLKGTKVNLVAYRERALTVPEVSEVQVMLHRARRIIELRYMSAKPAVARLKLEKAFAGSEIRPKLTLATLDELQGKKIKFEGVVIR